MNWDQLEAKWKELRRFGTGALEQTHGRGLEGNHRQEGATGRVHPEAIRNREGRGRKAGRQVGRRPAGHSRSIEDPLIRRYSAGSSLLTLALDVQRELATRSGQLCITARSQLAPGCAAGDYQPRVFAICNVRVDVETGADAGRGARRSTRRLEVGRGPGLDQRFLHNRWIALALPVMVRGRNRCADLGPPPESFGGEPEHALAAPCLPRAR